MPMRITVRMRESTGRKLPSSEPRWRNHTISIPIAANPESRMATAVSENGTFTAPTSIVSAAVITAGT